MKHDIVPTGPPVKVPKQEKEEKGTTRQDSVLKEIRLLSHGSEEFDPFNIAKGTPLETYE